MKRKTSRHRNLEPEHHARQHVNIDVAEAMLTESAVEDQTLNKVTKAKLYTHDDDFRDSDAQVDIHKELKLSLV